MNLVILEEANTTCALILTLINQKHTDIIVQKFIQAPFRVLFSISSFFRTHIIQLLLTFLFFFGGGGGKSI